MPPSPYFRVDRRLLRVGDTIEAKGDYFKTLSSASRAVEDLLEARRPPSKPSRRSCLFLFEDEEAARKLSASPFDHNLYRVAPTDGSILHHSAVVIEVLTTSNCERGSSRRAR